MRHRKTGRKLNRTGAHRKATLRNLVCNLFLTADRGEDRPLRITTTIPKAKEARRLAERCITLAKKALQGRQGEGVPGLWQSPQVRRLKALLGRADAIRCLLEDVAPLYNNRQGGYTRILRLASRRLGDGTDLCYFELVTEPLEERQVEPTEPVAPTRVAAPAEETPERGAPEAEEEAPAGAPEAQEEVAEGEQDEETAQEAAEGTAAEKESDDAAESPEAEKDQ
jgi:large subunit ribosomal protein L17